MTTYDATGDAGNTALVQWKLRERAKLREWAERNGYTMPEDEQLAEENEKMEDTCQRQGA